MYKKILFSIVFAIAIFGGFFITNSSNQAQAIAEPWRCVWRNSAKIQCAILWDWKNAPFVNDPAFIMAVVAGTPTEELNSYINKIGEDYDDGDYPHNTGDWWYQPDKSAAYGYPTFCRVNREDGEGPSGGPAGTPQNGTEPNGLVYGCLHLINNNPLLAYHDGNPGMQYGGGLYPVPAVTTNPRSTPNYWVIGKVENALKKADNEDCSILDTHDCHRAHSNGPDYGGEKIRDNESPLRTRIQALVAFADNENSCENSVELDFILCPIYNTAIDGIEWLLEGPLIDMLTIQLDDDNKIIPSMVGGGGGGG